MVLSIVSSVNNNYIMYCILVTIIINVISKYSLEYFDTPAVNMVPFSLSDDN